MTVWIIVWTTVLRTPNVWTCRPPGNSSASAGVTTWTLDICPADSAFLWMEWDASRSTLYNRKSTKVRMGRSSSRDFPMNTLLICLLPELHPPLLFLRLLLKAGVDLSRLTILIQVLYNITTSLHRGSVCGETIMFWWSEFLNFGCFCAKICF